MAAVAFAIFPASEAGLTGSEAGGESVDTCPAEEAPDVVIVVELPGLTVSGAGIAPATDVAAGGTICAVTGINTFAARVRPCQPRF